jgi:hypothetical protein
MLEIAGDGRPLFEAAYIDVVLAPAVGFYATVSVQAAAFSASAMI